MIKYTMLNRYRISLDETWDDFTRRLASTGIPKPTLHKVLTGRSNPNERTAAKLDRYIADHETEIRAAIGMNVTDRQQPAEPELAAATL